MSRTFMLVACLAAGFNFIPTSITCAYGYGGVRGGYTHVGPAGVEHVGYTGRDVPIGTGYTYRDLGYGDYRRGLSYGGYTPYIYPAPYTADYGRFGYYGRPQSPYASSYGANREAQQAAAANYSPPATGGGAPIGNVVPGSTGSSLLSNVESATTPTRPSYGSGYVYSPSYAKGLNPAPTGTGSSVGHGLGYAQ